MKRGMWIGVRLCAGGEQNYRASQLRPLGAAEALTAGEKDAPANPDPIRDLQATVDAAIAVSRVDGGTVPNVFVDKDGVERRQFEVYALPYGGFGARNNVVGLEQILGGGTATNARIIHQIKSHCGYYTLRSNIAEAHLAALSALVGTPLRMGIPGGLSTKQKPKKPKPKPKPKRKQPVAAPKPTSPEPHDCHLACKYGSARALKTFLDAEEPPDHYDLNRALCQAAWMGRGDLVRMLLDHGVAADANAGGDRQSPLFFAASAGRANAAQMLLDAGADASFGDVNGFSPLMVAVQFGHTEVARLLISKGADVKGSSTIKALREEMDAAEEKRQRESAAAAAASKPQAMPALDDGDSDLACSPPRKVARVAETESGAGF